MGPLGVPQPHAKAAVLTAPDSARVPAPRSAPDGPPLNQPHRVAEQERQDGPVWPDNRRSIEPGRAAEPFRTATEPARPPEPPWRSGPPPGDVAPPISPQYGDWARQQRVPGTVYGGAPPGHDPGDAPQGFDTAGSLSGQIFGNGEADPREEESGGGSKAVIIVMVVIGVLVVGALAAAIAYLSGAFH